MLFDFGLFILFIFTFTCMILVYMRILYTYLAPILSCILSLVRNPKLVTVNYHTYPIVQAIISF